MMFLGAGIVAAIVSFFIIGAIVYFFTGDAWRGFFVAVIGSIACGFWVAKKGKIWQDQDIKEFANYKRVYHYDMETVFKKLQLRMELAIEGTRYWSPKLVELSEGWLIYTYTNKKTIATVSIDTLSLMVAKARDVSDSLDEPKTEVIIHFWANTQLLAAGDLIRQAAWLTNGFDTTLPKHEKLKMAPSDLIQLQHMLPAPQP
jgi:hypothetical protein